MNLWRCFHAQIHPPTTEFKPHSVVICWNHCNNIFLFSPQLSALFLLGFLDHNQDKVVTLDEHFDYMGHTCLAFEMLDINLFQFMKRRQWAPLPCREIRPIAKQVGDRHFNTVISCSACLPIDWQSLHPSQLH